MPKGKDNSEDIAIVGIACRFPGASNYREYWKNIATGTNSIVTISKDRWNNSNVSGPHKAGLLNDIWNFDNYYFKITPKEAMQIDPQQRILLEEVKHCIDDAGLAEDILRTHRTSVFVGAMTSDFMVRGIEDDFPIDQYSCLGNYHSILANRVSYTFGFTGESVAIDAACASSLVAIHDARTNLLASHSDFSIAAGVNIICSPWKHRSFTKAGMLSPEGQCKTFDYSADGYVPGEGVGVLLLTRTNIAKKLGLKIYGLIKGSAANHNGRSRTITAPSVNAQAAVIADAIKQSGIATTDISYIEAHGTGTSLGDPIEVEALKKVFGNAANSDRFIGSVKTNIGHLEAAAGIAGVIKICMMFEHGEIPPTLNIQQANPIANFGDSFLKPCTNLRAWGNKNEQLTAGVSSFGFGGANSHIILQSAKQEIANSNENAQYTIGKDAFCLSAHSIDALKNTVALWQEYAAHNSHKIFSDVCYTLRNKVPGKYRLGIATDSFADLHKILAEFTNTQMVGDEQKFKLVLNEIEDPEKAISSLSTVSPYFVEQYQKTLTEANKIAGRRSSNTGELKQFCLLLTIAQLIVTTEVTIDYISGTGIGFLAAACISECSTLKDCIGAILKPATGINVNEATVEIPILIPENENPLQPFSYLQSYWPILLAESLPAQPICNLYIEKARLLYGRQGTFTNTINRWFDPLKKYGKDISQTLGTNTNLTEKDLLCLLIGVRLGLDEINNRWGLSNNFEDTSSLPELVNFLSLNICSSDDLLNFMLNQKGENSLQYNLQKNRNRVHKSNFSLLYKILEASTQAIKNVSIPDKGWLGHKKNEQGVRSITIGGEKAGDAVDQFTLTQVNKENYIRLLLHLWNNGGLLNWNDVLATNGKYAQGLPPYAFDKHSHYPQSSNPQINGIAQSVTIQPNEQIKVTNAVGVKTNSIQHNSNNASRQNIDGLRKNFIELFVTLAADATGVPASMINEFTNFADIGLDSAVILNLNEKLSQLFGATPVTLFFQNRNASELADYFINNHYEAVSAQFPITEQVKHQENDSATYEPVAQKKETAPSILPNQFNNEDIAIIGISGRYPGAENIEELWKLLREGKDSITEIPESRWAFQVYANERGRPGSVAAKWGGFLTDIDKFDPAVFGISPREAKFMSPQERLFLEEAYTCFDNAGYIQKLKTHNKRNENNIGVFVGTTYNDYQLYSQQQSYKADWVPTNAQTYSVANKVSYHFDLHGPSIVVDTACSSSLYAIHLACTSIRNGECELALAGGVNTSLHPSKYQMLAAYHFLSSDGKCRAFGEGGDGYVPGEAVGSILLKPLSKAIEDGDAVYAIIKGTAVSHGGKTHGYSVPNPQAQAKTIEDAITRSGINPETISYVEAHGTGTSLGDPIEISGLTEAFSKYTNKKQFCAIGSIKSNIGHAEAAAGITQVAKVVLQMKSGQLAPSLLHSTQLNAKIPFADTPFFVQTKLAPWTTQGSPKRSGISSFGAGGVNVHIILEEYDRREQRSTPTGQDYVIGISADTQEQLTQYAEILAHYISRQLGGETFLTPMNICELSNTLLNCREAKDVRVAFKANSLEEVIKQLKLIACAGDSKNWINHHIYFSGTEGIRWFQDRLNDEDQTLISTLAKSNNISSLAKLWAMGAGIDWRSILPALRGAPIYLPPYIFQKQRLWYNITATDSSVKQPVAVQQFQPIPKAAADSEHIEASNSIEDSFLDELADNPESVRLNLVKEQLKDNLAILLGHSSGKAIKTDVGFFNMGVDSMQLVSMQVNIKATYGIDLPETTFFEYSTVNRLSERILSSLNFNKHIQKRQAPKTSQQPQTPINVMGHANGRSNIDAYSLNEIEQLDPTTLTMLLEQETKGY